MVNIGSPKMVRTPIISTPNVEDYPILERTTSDLTPMWKDTLTVTMPNVEDYPTLERTTSDRTNAERHSP